MFCFDFVFVRCLLFVGGLFVLCLFVICLFFNIMLCALCVCFFRFCSPGEQPA